jgi:drug/metabolite transporter (DMT)-like permease
MAILAVAGTMLSLIIFYKLVQQTSALFGASVAFMIPIVAMLWGVVDGERITLFHILSMGLIILGVYLSRRRPAHHN